MLLWRVCFIISVLTQPSVKCLVTGRPLACAVCGRACFMRPEVLISAWFVIFGGRWVVYWMDERGVRTGSQRERRVSGIKLDELVHSLARFCEQFAPRSIVFLVIIGVRIRDVRIMTSPALSRRSLQGTTDL